MKIGGLTVTLENEFDLAMFQGLVRSEFRHSVFQTDEQQNAVRTILADYEAAGCPPLISAWQVRFNERMAMRALIGPAYDAPRFDHPGTYGPDLM